MSMEEQEMNKLSLQLDEYDEEDKIESKGNTSFNDIDESNVMEEINKLTEQLKEYEDQNEKLNQKFDKTLENSAFNKDEIDSRSAFVGNVDFSTTPEELQELFQSCGAINRVTIMVNKWTGTPKGYAYIEFTDKSSVATAVGLNDSMFKGRELKVTAKRTNVPKFLRRRSRRRSRRRRRRY